MKDLGIFTRLQELWYMYNYLYLFDFGTLILELNRNQITLIHLINLLCQLQQRLSVAAGNVVDVDAIVDA